MDQQIKNKYMIKIKEKKKSTKKIEPYYKLTFNYMIGDANGNTSEEVDVSVDNPYVERFVKLLNSLKPVKGTWGVILNYEDIEKSLEEKQITQDDYNFLMTLLFERWDDDEEVLYEISEENKEHSYAFFDAVRSDTEYSFLVFEGIRLQYVDENKIKHDTIIE